MILLIFYHMEGVYIVANWKSNMTQTEAAVWMQQMQKFLGETAKTIIICPSFTLLPFLSKDRTNQLHMGAQDISPFGMGAYTGEVNGGQIKEFASYVIIGHSERRNYFKEDDQILTQKVMMAKKSFLTPIFCVQGSDTFIPDGVSLVAYEPIWAIGTGKAESPEQANEVAKTIKEKSEVSVVLYGGSVTGENVQLFTGQNNISGVLVGGASLHPQQFLDIIAHA